MLDYHDACAKAIVAKKFTSSYLRGVLRDFLSSSEIIRCYAWASGKRKVEISQVIARLADSRQGAALLTQPNILLHVLIKGETEKLIRDYRNSPDAQTTYANHLIFHPDELWADIAYYIRNLNRPLSQEKRFELIEGVLKMVDVTGSGLAGVPFDHRIEPGAAYRPYCFYLRIYHGLLTEDEVLEHGPRFAELVAVNGELYRHIGLLNLKHGKKEVAADFLLKGMQRRALEKFVFKRTLQPYKQELLKVYQ